MIGQTPICIRCKHLRRDPNRFICDAFPDGIPALIASAMFEHTESYPGDNGIRFEPLDEDGSDGARELAK